MKDLPNFKNGRYNEKTAQKIIDHYTKKYKIKVSEEKYSSLVGKATPFFNKIKVPHLNNPQAFLINLHEVAHIINYEGFFSNKETFEEEYESEIFAIKTAQKLNLNKCYIRTYKKRAKLYVLHHIINLYGKNLNLKRIPQKILRWLEWDLSKFQDCEIIEFYKLDRNSFILKAKTAENKKIQKTFSIYLC